ncbi:MAG: hypothetical protein WC647_17340 [Desulfomonilaceae bacterium]|jgi:hypothetical protein
MESKIQIEQMETLEKRLGVPISQVSGRTVDDAGFEVIFELRVLNGGQLRESICVVGLIYNNSGELIGRSENFFDSKRVFAFTSGSVYFFKVTGDDIKKIVIYPERN